MDRAVQLSWQQIAGLSCDDNAGLQSKFAGIEDAKEMFFSKDRFDPGHGGSLTHSLASFMITLNPNQQVGDLHLMYKEQTEFETLVDSLKAKDKYWWTKQEAFRVRDQLDSWFGTYSHTLTSIASWHVLYERYQMFQIIRNKASPYAHKMQDASGEAYLRTMNRVMTSDFKAFVANFARKTKEFHEATAKTCCEHCYDYHGWSDTSVCDNVEGYSACQLITEYWTDMFEEFAEIDFVNMHGGGVAILEYGHSECLSSGWAKLHSWLGTRWCYPTQNGVRPDCTDRAPEDTGEDPYQEAWWGDER